MLKQRYDEFIRAYWVRVAGAGAVAVGMTIVGWGLSGAVSNAAPEVLTQPPSTIVHTHIRVLHRLVRGKVVTLRSGERVVKVSRVVIVNRGCYPTRTYRCVRRVVVPAHTVPLREATLHDAVITAAPNQPVTVTDYVTMPVTTYMTVTTPAQTITQTQTTTETTTAEVTVTVTVPIVPPPEGPP
jgi:hypothetical protein